jgi:hypothetical protein
MPQNESAAAGLSLSSTTFKPALDRSMSRDGLAVVLWATRREMVLLRYVDGAWRVTRHAAGETLSRGHADAYEWRQMAYAAVGQELECLTESAPLEQWDRVYRRCLGDWIKRLQAEGRPLDMATGLAAN